MGGTAMIIIMQQLKGLLGMKHFTPKTDLISVVGSIFKYRHEVSELPFNSVIPRSTTAHFSLCRRHLEKEDWFFATPLLFSRFFLVR